MAILDGLSLGASLIGGALGASGANKAAKAQRANFQAALQALKGLEPQSDRAFAGEMAGLSRAGGEINRGFGKARVAAARSGRSATADILEERTKTLGDLKQHMLGTGTFSSALYANAVRGTSAQATRQMAKVREMVAGMIGEIESARGGALAELEMQKGAAWGRNYDRKSDLASQLVGLRSQYQPTATSGAAGWGSFMASLAPLLGQFGKGGGSEELPGGGTSPYGIGPGYKG